MKLWMTFLFFASLVTSLVAQTNVNTTLVYNSEDDVAVRRKTIKAIAIKAPKSVPENILSIAQAGLADADSEVREHSLAIVYRLGTAKLYYPEMDKFDLGAHEELKGAIISALDDEDRKVRELAVDTLAAGLAPSPATEELFVACYKKEPEGRIRRRVIESLLVHKYTSSNVVSLLKTALKEDAHSGVRGYAARGLGELQPDNALPLLVQELHSENPFVREGAARAIAAYGDKALPYLSTLEAMKEGTTEKKRLLLDETISEIRRVGLKGSNSSE